MAQCEARARGCTRRAKFKVSDFSYTLKLCRYHKDWAVAAIPLVVVKRLRWWRRS
jgi:hypothetical protein